ncbi:MAG: tRNA pseudouridine(54/55) synthase Pus10 [Methanobacteriaceae archaeon]
MNTETVIKAKKLIELCNGAICNYCLGRKFSDIVEGNGNLERGLKIRNTLHEIHTESSDFESDSCECYICGNIFDYLENNVIESVNNKIDRIGLEFNNFLVGCKLPEEIVRKDKELSEELDLDVEEIKKELNREIGKILEAYLEKEVEFDLPNIVILVNLTRFNENDSTINQNKKNQNFIRVHFQINPLFIEGRYLKLVRGIPQTKWPCRKCKGRGCESCDFTGKMYPESVEELISRVVLKATQGREAKFHGAGREDIDVRMLGTGRPFVLEIKEPKIRNLDLITLNKEINQNSYGKTEYTNLKFSYPRRKAEIKVSSPDTYKVYQALVKTKKSINIEDLKKINVLLELDSIKQRTPVRVSHRRADKIRERKVKELKLKLIDENTFEMIINAQGGLYIKELISGDEGRSIPSVSSLLGFECICEQLDVIEVAIK